ncbi:hypothetical protein [Tenacibaculum sp. 190524A05c]|uniref:hypothetical protein n=1 Tax=Tenacibaculum platacis TaxID=3137852 RepID=UPI0031FA51E5
MKENNSKLIGLLLIITFFIGFTLYQNNKEDLITKRAKITSGRIYSLSYKNPHRGSGKSIDYKYFINNNEYKSKDPFSKHQTFKKRVRLSEPIIGKFYPVEYDSLNPKESRIIITEEALNPFELTHNGLKINGDISKISGGHNPYFDFFITYKFRGEKFSFRTRLHQDSINCGSIENCRKTKKIELKISEEYPFFNDLYFKSRDRQKFKALYSK